MLTHGVGTAGTHSVGLAKGGCGASAAYMALRLLGQEVKLANMGGLVDADGTTSMADLFLCFEGRGINAQLGRLRAPMADALSTVAAANPGAVIIVARGEGRDGHFVVVARSARRTGRLLVLDSRAKAAGEVEASTLASAPEADILIVSAGRIRYTPSHWRMATMFYVVLAGFVVGIMLAWLLRRYSDVRRRGVALLTTALALGALFPGCGAKSQATGLRCDEPVWYGGEVQSFGQISHTFLLRNHTDRTVKIRRIRSTCLCAEAKSDKIVVEAGETVQIAAILKVGRRGRELAKVYASTDCPSSPLLELVMFADAVEPITCPDYLSFGRATADQATSAQFQVRFPANANTVFPREVRTKTSADWLSSDATYLLDTEEYRSFGARVSVDMDKIASSTESGWIVLIAVYSEGIEVPVKRIPCYVNNAPHYVLSPAAVFLADAEAGKEVECVVHLTRSPQGPIVITGTETNGVCTGVTVRDEPESEGKAVVIAVAPRAQGLYSGSVRVTIDGVATPLLVRVAGTAK